MPRPSIAVGWLAACGGCDEALLDLDEALLFELAPQVEIVYWPVAVDAKHEQLQAKGRGEILACLLSGAVRTEEMAEHVRLMREKSQYLIAVGACAQRGGVPALANAVSKAELLAMAYGEAFPASGLPQLTSGVLPVQEIVEVDYVVPGCPPTAGQLGQLLRALLEGKLPPPGHVFAEPKALCHYCSRLATKPEDLVILELKRVHEVQAVAETCLLAQGLVCLGPATRGGCGERCVSANMPCRGCFGPPAGVNDQAAAMLTFLAGHAPVDGGEDAVQRYVESLPDPVGTCYRFGLPQRERG